VQHYWAVRWDLRGHPPQRRETLPHPNIHLVIDQGSARVHGIHDGRFATVLDGRSGVFGVKFRPGGFRAVLGRSVSTLRNRSVSVSDLIDNGADLFHAIDPVDSDDAAKIAIAEAFLLNRRPSVDASGILAGSMVDAIAADVDIHSVQQVATRFAIGARSLQRLFNEQVGIGVKWVINRYRIHEALERLDGGMPAAWGRIALDLGYFDQAHFIRDFKQLVGCTPVEYARMQTTDCQMTISPILQPV
jgi:AraC-like DNA-binding protein